MRVCFFVCLFFLFSTKANSQYFQTVEEVNNACAQLGFSSDEEAELTVDRILEKIGLFRNFIIQECPDIENAVAKNLESSTGEKLRYILYDNDFFNTIDENADNRWASVSILAHEIAHHLNGHALNNQGSNHQFELEADYSSGFYLAKMGATLAEAQSAIETLRYEKATHTHPAKADRLASIKKGWLAAKKQILKEIEEEEDEEEEVPFSVIDEQPVFPGCAGSNAEKRYCFNQSMGQHVSKHFNASIAYDLGLVSDCIQEKQVYDEESGVYRTECVKWKPIHIDALFIINKYGEVEIEGVRAPHPALQEEAKRILNLLPKMKPGLQRGQPVAVRYSLPIRFIVPD